MHVRVGMEATGLSRWFERLRAELDFELWIVDPAEIRAKRVKKQKYDREDARLLLRPLREGMRWKKKLWSAQGRAELEKLSLAPWASRRREELLELLDRLTRASRS